MSSVSEICLVLAPHGRDAAIASAMLSEAGIEARPCAGLTELVESLDHGIGFVVATEEAFPAKDMRQLSIWLRDQPNWSDLPFILATSRGGVERNPAAARHLELIGNVTFLERPFHPTTLVSLAQAALRGRRRQYEARARLEALNESETRLRLAVENAEIGFWDVDVVNDRLVWPPSTKAMFGISADVPVSMDDFYSGLYPADMGATSAAYAAAADPARRALYDVEYRTIGKEDGILRWVAAKGRGLFDGDGPGARCLRVLGTAIDISRRKAAEAALRQGEDRLRLAVDATAIGIFDYDFATGLMEWDDQVRAAFGFTSGRPITYDLFLAGLHPDDRRRTEAALRRAADPAIGIYHVEYRTIGLDDGIERWVAARGRTVFEDGKAVRFIGTTLDISGSKERERALSQSEAVLRIQSEALAALNETLEQRVADEVERRVQAEDALRQAQKMETLGQLTGGVAHDFNNLLQIVSGNIEIIQRNLPDDHPRLQRAADNAARGAERAAVLTQRLLAFSRRQPLAPKPLEPNKLVAGMSDLLHRTLGETVAVETVLASGLWMVEVDPNQLENAILNLAVNGRDAMAGEDGGGGKLTIETCNTHLDRAYAEQNSEVQAGQYVCICVSDTGSGMDADTATRAFEPFFTTKDVGKGTGLGLSMVYGFVKQSGGHLKIYSEIGEGTTVKIFLPRLMDAKPVIEEVVDAGAPEVGQNETILVCEDDDDVRDFTCEVLRELGYRVLEAHDGPSALRQLQNPEVEVDLFFTDVVLPSGMSGAVLAREARLLRPDLRILFTTGYARNAIVHHGRLDAGVELITKPFSYTDLAARVRDMLDGAVQGGAA